MLFLYLADEAANTRCRLQHLLSSLVNLGIFPDHPVHPVYVGKLRVKWVSYKQAMLGLVHREKRDYECCGFLL